MTLSDMPPPEIVAQYKGVFAIYWLNGQVVVRTIGKSSRNKKKLFGRGYGNTGMQPERGQNQNA